MSGAQDYFSIRSRMLDALQLVPKQRHDTIVPACPSWTVHELLVHLASMPQAILAGDIPEGPDPNPWIAGLIERHRAKTFDEVISWWQSNDDALRVLADSAQLLTVDLFIHESDLHGAIGSIGHRAAPELAEQLACSVRTLAAQIDTAGLAPVAIETDLGCFVTGDGAPGWTVQTGAWEAHRLLNSRRTADEIRALPSTGQAEAYLVLLDQHLPLPIASLGE